MLAVAKALLDDHVRILHVALSKTRPPEDGSTADRGYHSDWPHDLASLVSVSSDDPGGDSGSGRPEERREFHHCGAVAQPFPGQTMALSTIWLLSDSSPTRGGTFIVPVTSQATHQLLVTCRSLTGCVWLQGSHADSRNPRSVLDGIDGQSPIPGELQITAPAGSVFIQDCRTWHTAAHNPSTEPRVAAVVRYAPSWLAAEMGWGDGAQEWVPLPTYQAMPRDMQQLVSHRACGVVDTLQPAKLDAAEQARGVWAAKQVAAAALSAEERALLNVKVAPVAVPLPTVRFDRAEQRMAREDPCSIQGRLLKLSSEGFCVLDGATTPHDAALLRQQLAAAGGNAPRHALESCPVLAEIFSSQELLALAGAALDSHLRIIDLEIVPPSTADDPTTSSTSCREWQTDPPHDLCCVSGCGAVRHPFPPVTMALTVTLVLPTEGQGSGCGLRVVPGSHRDHRHPCIIDPTAPSDNISPFAPLSGEAMLQQASLDLVVRDTRLWHSRPVLHGGMVVATLAP